MADTVQYLLEEQLPELEDYEKKGYFSRAELKQIIAKRRDFEYRLKRRAALKIDYYRYIEYETKLEELRRHRKVKLGIKGQKSIAENAIVKHIHFIYERATRKFKSDLQLWMDWLIYCKRAKSTKMHSKVVTKALQRHATTPLLWIEAASWEFECNGNVAAARALMQQGLRMCKHDEVMWAEYLRMELLYIDRLRARRVVLGLDVPQAMEAAPERGGKRKEKKLKKAATAEPADRGGEEGVEVAGAAVEEGEGAAAEAAARAVLTGAVARVVVRSAVAALPTSLSLRKALLQVLACFDIPGVREIEGDVYEGIARDFGGDEGAWDVLARRPLADAASERAGQQTAGSSQQALAGADREVATASFSGVVSEAAHNTVCDVYQRAVQAVQSERMYELYCKYLEQRLEGLMAMAAEAAETGTGAAGVDSSAPSSATAAAASTKQGKGKRRRDATGAGVNSSGDTPTDGVVAAGAELLSAYGAAHAARLASAQLYLSWVRWAGRLGQQRMALSAAKQGCSWHPGCMQLWACRLDAEATPAGGSGGDTDLRQQQLLKTLQQGLAAVRPAESAELWLKVLEHVQPGTHGFSHLSDMMVTAVSGSASGPTAGGLGRATAAMLQRVREAQGIEAARAFYRRFLTLPAPGGEFFHAAIALERHEEDEHQAREPGPAAVTRSAGGASASAHPNNASALPRPHGSKARAKAHGSGHVRQLFEAAVACYGAVDADLWLDYARYEAMGLNGAGPIYWRATKALHDPDSFVTRYQESVLG